MSSQTFSSGRVTRFDNKPLLSGGLFHWGTICNSGHVEEKPSVLIFESKSDHLASNDDSVYKSRVFGCT